MSKPVKVAIVGLGSRGKDTYAKCAKLFPEKMKIVAIADIVKEKVDEVAKEYDVPKEMCFNSAEELLAQDKLADALFICTMDKQHYGHAIPALKKGYHLLLEKPISPDLKECAEIAKVAKDNKRHVVVCHVLRYTPFYQELKRIIDEGTIGDVVSMQAIENVCYYHQAHSFVRGNWANSDETSPMILQKCCHDMDILIWLANKRSKYVSSYGSLRLFKPENAPEGSTKRCLDGCKAKENCPFDAEKIYITDKATGVANGKNGWPCNVLTLNPTVESVTKALEEGPYGVCVYHANNNVVDHQVVNIEMEDGATINFTMCAFTSKGHRSIKIMGTKGDIEASMDTNLIDIGRFGKEHEIIDVKTLAKDFSGHAGGDNVLVKDLMDLIINDVEPGSGLTSIDHSVESHYLSLAAEYSRLHHGESVNINELDKLK